MMCIGASEIGTLVVKYASVTTNTGRSNILSTNRKFQVISHIL